MNSFSDSVPDLVLDKIETIIKAFAETSDKNEKIFVKLAVIESVIKSSKESEELHRRILIDKIDSIETQIGKQDIEIDILKTAQIKFQIIFSVIASIAGFIFLLFQKFIYKTFGMQ